MTVLLLCIGIVVAFGIMFWLDKKQGPEPTPAIVHLFDVLKKLRWDMNENDIRATFKGFKHGGTSKLNKKSTLSRKENFEGQEIYTTFSFPKKNGEKVNKGEIRLSRVNRKDIDLLFRTVCKTYGNPQESGTNKDGAVKWPTEIGVLTLENPAPEEYLLTLTEEDTKV